MLARLTEDNAAADARAAAEHSIWEIFQPVISGVSSEYRLQVVLHVPEEAVENEAAADTGTDGAAETEAADADD